MPQFPFSTHWKVSNSEGISAAVSLSNTNEKTYNCKLESNNQPTKSLKQQ